MRTGRSLTVCRSLLPGGCLLQGGVCLLWGGCLLPGGWVCLLWEVSAPGGGCLLWRGICSWGVCVCSGGVCSGGGIPACTEADTPPPLWTEWQTGAKILPWPQLITSLILNHHRYKCQQWPNKCKETKDNWVGYHRWHVSRQWPTSKLEQEICPRTRTNQQYLKIWKRCRASAPALL